ncbi:uncharacterized protein FOMMEDRAFT_73019 [Fomitiporia mediterranea MF3/22]|uniref:uncharacterized protein n=1 Tax=Fomitiporia mediterranea (strain MF3/22) TaxID=694068 RepID=UPI0004409BCF|nr:uncharacterized protein FOMMEDRAFT_73019 [Fomitiporia mediterranea MF3/22]EJD07958.1 hypothetical protein FOMMEDRAFT_73019 [Fomitiporia mediterranea MF3/22]
MSQGPRKKTISATTLAVHHHLQCDLFLCNSYHGSESYRSNGARSRPTPSELTKAILSRGDRWESTLFSWLDENNLLLRVLGGSLTGEEIQEVVEIDERDHFFVAGLSFVPPASAFEKKFRAKGRNPVQFGVAKPDLVEIKKEKDGTILWQVVDAKSSAEVKTSHHVQIYFYHVCLENLLSFYYKSMGTAAVWIPPSIYGRTSIPSFEDLKSIATPLLSLPLDDFLFNKLPQVLALQRNEVKWHLNPLCRGCTYENECTERAVRGGEFGSMANITIQDADVLNTFLAISHRQNHISDIEDLYATIRPKSRTSDIQKTHPSIFKKAKRILKIQDNSSPVLDAALTKRVQILNKRIFTLPREEDIAIVISLVLDPSTNEIAAYCISTFTNIDAPIVPGSLSGTRETFIPDLASVIQHILDLSEVHASPPRTQCYVFNPAERSALQRTLIDAALTSDKLEDEVQDAIRTCIGALCEGASLLATTFQPIVLSGALLSFLTKKGVSTAELNLCLRRLGLPHRNGSDEELRQRIQDELERLKNCDDSDPRDRSEIGHLPRVVALKNAIEQLLALPIPGYWDLPGCHRTLKSSSLICPSDEAIYSAVAASHQAEYERMLQDRTACIHEVLNKARQRVSDEHAGKTDILVNDARVLTSEFMDICSQDHLRKLFFMQQFEVLAKLNTLWQDRIEGCVEAPRLKYKFTNRMSDNSYLHYLTLESGYVDLSSERDRTYYDYILTEDVDSDQELPIEALFDDLAVFNLMFPLNKYTRSRWSQQPLIVQQRLFVADVNNMVIRNNRTFVVLRTFGDFNLRLRSNARYRLSPRLVDFNVTKVLSTLVELDLQTPSHPGYMQKPPFLQLFSDSKAFAKFLSESDSIAERYWAEEKRIQRWFRELSGLGQEAANSLLFKPSQEHALHRILKYRLSVIWGPPGGCTLRRSHW